MNCAVSTIPESHCHDDTRQSFQVFQWPSLRIHAGCVAGSGRLWRRFRCRRQRRCDCGPTPDSSVLSSEQATQLADLNRQSLAAAAIGSDTIASTDAVSSALAAPQRKAFVKVTMYRFFNTRTGAHFYTVSTTERDTIKDDVCPTTPTKVPPSRCTDRPPTGLSPVYRFYNRNTGTHLYTISETEKATIQASYPYFSLDGCRLLRQQDAAVRHAPRLPLLPDAGRIPLLHRQRNREEQPVEQPVGLCPRRSGLLHHRRWQ